MSSGRFRRRWSGREKDKLNNIRPKGQIPILRLILKDSISCFLPLLCVNYIRLNAFACFVIISCRWDETPEGRRVEKGARGEVERSEFFRTIENRNLSKTKMGERGGDIPP